MEDRLPRKLAAVLYADVAGYSRLTGADEDGTHRVLRSYLTLISSSVETHNGRTVHYAGDAVLADFNTVFDAMSCATDIQKELQKRNQELPRERRVQFRVGVNLGDVIVDQQEIYGEGVNVAARLEGLAEPGGICLSDAVRVALGNSLSLKYKDLGEQKVKNIAEPVRVWRWVNDEGSPPGDSSSAATISNDTNTPIIAVLPFENLSRDRNTNDFADGITEELVTGFSRQTGMKVLSRHSTLPFKERTVDIAEVGRTLGVHYVLEGSVRKAGTRVRVAARLVDAGTGNDIWGDQYDAEAEDVFALQDELRLGIVAAVRTQIHTKDAYRVRNLPEDELTDGELLALASRRIQSLGLDNYQEAARLLSVVCQRSPDNAMALAMSASCILLQNGFDYKPLAQAEADRAFKLIDKAVQLSEESDYAHYVRGRLLLIVRREHDLAIAEAERERKRDRVLISLNPRRAVRSDLVGAHGPPSAPGVRGPGAPPAAVGPRHVY